MHLFSVLSDLLSRPSTVGYKTALCATPDCGVNYIDEPTCSVECDVGYYGVRADATCAVDGGHFDLSGCAPMCVQPTDTTGLDLSSETPKALNTTEYSTDNALNKLNVQMPNGQPNTKHMQHGDTNLPRKKMTEEKPAETL
eukprot:2460554-Amphidinium_carterae.1